MRLALYQPDIPQNAGSLIRLCACLGVGLDLIEPCGFLVSDRNFRRAGLDYAALALVQGLVTRHPSWEEFQAGRATQNQKSRLVLLTTKSAQPYAGFNFRPDDTILVGRESAGVPDDVHQAADARLLIPMRPGLRSINVAQAAAMALGEALRQTDTFPGASPERDA